MPENQPPLRLLELAGSALHLWWRWTWRITIIGLAAVIAPTTLLVAATAQHSALLGVAAGVLYLVALGLYLWAMGEVMKRYVFTKQVDAAGSCAVVIVSDRPQALPLRTGVAWAVLWAVNWRAFVLDLALKVILVALAASGLPSPAAGVLGIVGGLAAQVAAYAWFMARSYGRTGVALARLAQHRGIPAVEAA